MLQSEPSQKKKVKKKKANKKKAKKKKAKKKTPCPSLASKWVWHFSFKNKLESKCMYTCQIALTSKLMIN